MGTKESQVARRGYELNPETAKRRNALFDQYIKPYFNLVYKLCMKYSASPATVKENYSLVLTNLYRGIETYDPEKPIMTWIHICTKRHVIEHEKRRAREKELRDNDHEVGDLSGGEIVDFDRPSANLMDEHNWRQFYNDDIIQALDSLNPIHRDALILQEAGYSLKEIAEIEYKKGRLESRNIDTVKSRLFLARRTLMKKLNRNGTKKTD